MWVCLICFVKRYSYGSAPRPRRLKGHVKKSGTKFLKIFCTHVPTSWGHIKNSGTKFLQIFCTHVPTSWRYVKNMDGLCQEYTGMLFFCLPLSIQPRLNTQQQGREDGHIFLTCLQLVGTWVQNMFRNLVPDFLTCPQLVGTWVQNIFRKLVPDFWHDSQMDLDLNISSLWFHGISSQ